MSKEIETKIRTWLEWSYETFGYDSNMHLGKINHLLKELIELLKAFNGEGNIGEEFADCFILLTTAALHTGIDLENMIENCDDKFEILKKRKWGKPDKNGVVEHIKKENFEI